MPQASPKPNGYVPRNGNGSPCADPERERDAVLVARLKAGEEAAFRDLVEGHGPRMLAVARRFLSREADAEDALQDAFLSVFRAVATFAGESRLSTWLHRVTVNAALMRIRSRSRRPETSMDDFFGEAANEVPEDVGTLAAPDALEREEIRDRVRAALDRLPEGIQAVLRLHDIQGLDLRETADLLGVGLTTVKTRLYAGRHALRNLLNASLGAAP